MGIARLGALTDLASKKIVEALSVSPEVLKELAPQLIQSLPVTDSSWFLAALQFRVVHPVPFGARDPAVP